MHYQIWIEAGDKPVVRKIVITQKMLPGSPQWTAYSLRLEPGASLSGRPVRVYAARRRPKDHIYAGKESRNPGS